MLTHKLFIKSLTKNFISLLANQEVEPYWFNFVARAYKSSLHQGSILKIFLVSEIGSATQ
jgi:hypothetical protein